MLERDGRVIDRLEQALLSPGHIISTVDQPALTPDDQNLLSKLNPLYSHVMHTTRLSIKVFLVLLSIPTVQEVASLFSVF